MRSILILFIPLWMISACANAQTSIGIFGTASTMMLSPEPFDIAKAPLGFGVQMNVVKNRRENRFITFEWGLENYKFEMIQSTSTSIFSSVSKIVKNVDWNQLYIFVGGRYYVTDESRGVYLEPSGGLFCVMPNGLSRRDDKIFSGGGGQMSLGFASGIIDFGILMKVGLTAQGFAASPLFRLGLRMNQQSKKAVSVE